MKLKKLHLYLLVLLLLAITISACGGATPTKADNEGTTTSAIVETEAEEKKIEGKTFNAGKVKTLVPEGWTALGAAENMEGYVEEGRPDYIYLVKGVGEDINPFQVPGIQITYYAKDTEMLEVSKDFYDDTADLDSIDLENYTWEGYTGKSMGAPLAVLYANSDKPEDDQYQIAVWYKMGDGEEISLDDPDVLAILSSIQASD